MTRSWRTGIATALVVATAATDWLVGPRQPASADPGRRVAVPTVDYYLEPPSGLTAGTDGNVWFRAGASVGRITPAGAITSFLLDHLSTERVVDPVTDLVADENGVWFTTGRTIRRLTYAGDLTTYAGGLSADPTTIDAGPDGQLWFAGDRGRIGLLSPTGEITERVITDGRGRSFTGSSDLVVAADGTAWVLASRSDTDFQETYTSIVRVDEDGRILARVPDLRFSDIDEFGARYATLSRGPAGAVWYLREDQEASYLAVQGRIGRLIDSAAVPVWEGPAARDLALGPDGALWFGLTERWWNPEPTTPTLGRLTGAGAFSDFAVGYFDHRAILGGPDDMIWFTNDKGLRRVSTTGDPVASHVPPFGPPLYWRTRPDATGGQIEWVGPLNDGGPFTYRIDIRPGGRQENSADSPVVITGLRTGLSYEVTCRAQSEAGIGLPDRVILTPLAQRSFGPAHDFGGTQRADPAVFRPATGTWLVRDVGEVRWGADGDVPVAADYTGDGRAEFAVWRPRTGTWFVKGVRTQAWGRPGDIPVPADYTGDGTADLAVFRPSDGRWYVRGRPSLRWGADGDIPVPGNFGGDRRADFTVWRPSSGTWYRYGAGSIRYGTTGDRPVVIDTAGDGRDDIAVYRPVRNLWYVRGSAPIALGGDGAIPFPGDFDADPGDEAAYFRPWDGHWQLPNGAVSWGLNGDLPV